MGCHTPGLRGYWSGRGPRGPEGPGPAPGLPSTREGWPFRVCPVRLYGPNWPAAHFPPTPARPVGPPHPTGLRPKIESDPVPPAASGKEMPYVWRMLSLYVSGPVRDPALTPGEAGHPRPSEIFSRDDAPAKFGIWGVSACYAVEYATC